MICQDPMCIGATVGNVSQPDEERTEILGRG